MLFADAFLGKFFKNCLQRNKKKTTQDARQCMEYEIFESLHILKLHVHTAPRRQLEVSLCFWGEFKKKKEKETVHNNIKQQLHVMLFDRSRKKNSCNSMETLIRNGRK